MKDLLSLCFCALSVGCGAASEGRPVQTPQREATDNPHFPLSPPSGPGAATNSSAGYDAMLTGYDYPFPVRHFSVRAQGHDLALAYMIAEPSQPNGRVVTLLHGKNFSGAFWRQTAEALTGAGYRVVMPDQLGFGKSSKPTDFQYSFHAMAQVTQALLRSLNIQQSAIVGHSMGGMLATRFALMFPGSTTSLTLVNPIGLEDWKRKVPYVSVDTWTERNQEATPESIRSYMEKSYFGGEWQPAYDPLVAIQAGWALGPDRDRMARISALHYDMIFTQPVVYEFADVSVPTLLVIGQRDRTALGKPDVRSEVAATLGDYPKLGRLTQETIPNATLVELDGIGHVPQVEAFDAWASALLTFLARPARDTGSQ